MKLLIYAHTKIWLRTSCPLPLTMSGASARRVGLMSPRCFLPKWNKDLALKTSCNELCRMGTVPFGQLVPFLCHICHAPFTLLLDESLASTSAFSIHLFTFGISVGTLCNYINVTKGIYIKENIFFYDDEDLGSQNKILVKLKPNCLPESCGF